MSTHARGYQYGGSGASVRGAQFDGPQGGQFTGSDVAAPDTRGIPPRGVAYGGGGPTPGAQYAATTIDAYGGQYDGPADASVVDLIDVDGFALVLENPSGSERLAFSPQQPAYQDIKGVQWTSEVNQMASWSATVPMNPKVYDWPFSQAVIAYGGERRFHGVLLPVESSQISDGELTLSGYGPLYWGGHGDIRVSYSGIAAWRAIDDLWLRVARATDGRVRGNTVRPRPAHINDHMIPEDGIEWEGTPTEVLKQAHGYAGMAFSIDHTEPAAVATSFVPGEQLRQTEWLTTSIKPAISPEGYHNQVTVIGAKRPNRPGRFRATATAPQREIDAVLDGEIHGRTVRNSDLESEDACQARAATLLAEDRGEYTVGGALDVTPGTRRLVPGYTYRIEEFDAYVPSVFSPVWCSLRSVSHSYSADEATISLSFDDESGVVGHIRQDLAPELAPNTIKRRESQMSLANPNNTPPMNVDYHAGAGAAGSGFAGGVADNTSQEL